MDYTLVESLVVVSCTSTLTLWSVVLVLGFVKDTWVKEALARPTFSKQLWLGCSVAFLAYQTSQSLVKSGLADLVKGNDPKLDEILRLAPSITRGPSPPLGLSNAHLQFAPWMIQNEFHNGAIPFQEKYLNLTACLDKTVDTATCYRPPNMTDEVRLDIFPPFDDPEYPQFNRSSPTILFEPGLRCHSQDMPGNMIIRLAYEAGFRSIAINRRGHIPGQKLKAPRWNLFGDIDDLEQTYWKVKEDMLEPDTPIFLHGISSGCAVTVTALSAWDKRRTLTPSAKTPSFVAAITVTPGYDTSRVFELERFKVPYNPLMNYFVKSHFVEKNVDVLEPFSSSAYHDSLNASNLQDFLGAAAPFAGYPNASAYYAGENPVNDLHYINTPVFVMNSLDDPCCAISNFYEKSPYPQHDGRSFASIVNDSQRGLVAVTKSGSHCPFLDGMLFPFVRDPFGGGWMLKSWADEAGIDFYKAALQVYGDRAKM
mmetsp:Transcript_6273/g.13049  ORF Transcript_6273/g.13049 Transcript_6273/m.13049 type:complete len:482 (-) Transcript_6273:40-1485(-)